MKKFRIPEAVYKTYNCPRCNRIDFRNANFDDLRNAYHDIRGQPGFIDALLHINPESRDVRLLAERPDLCQWSDDGTLLILPNLPSITPEKYVRCPQRLKDTEEGIYLNAWFIHPSQLQQSIFHDQETRGNFAKAASSVCYASSLEPKTTIERNVNQRRIRDLEQQSGIPYLASILDLNASYLPWLKMARHTIIQHLQNEYKVSNKDKVAIYFHLLPPEKTTTCHLHITVNQGLHPLDAANSLMLDDVINALEHGKSMQEIIMRRGAYTSKNPITSLAMHERIPDVVIKEIDNPFLLQSPLVDNCAGKPLQHYIPVNNASGRGSTA